MRLQRFVAEREAGWTELEGLLGDAGSKPEKLGPDRILRTGTLYRAAAADLSLARRSFPGDPVTLRLETLVAKGRQTVYADERRRGGLAHFLTTGYWQRVRERPWLLALAAVLLFGSLALSTIWAIDDPAAAAGVIPAEFADSAEPGAERPDDLSAGEASGLSGVILTNNIRVSFLAFAGGMLLGLGTAGILLYNGLFIGAIAGTVIGAGQTEPLLRLIVPHGVLELSLIVVAGMAGLRVAQAIIEPGTLTRGQSLINEARPAIELVLGSMPWFVLAGLTEGFITGEIKALPLSLAVGFALGGLYWGLVLWRGKPQSRARALARR